MKIVVIGGSGLIGSKLVNRLRQLNHEVLSASPDSGINTITGVGLNEALKGANVVVDVSNSPSFEDKAVLEFFQTSTGNIIKAETSAGVKHHVLLTVVGTDRSKDGGYFRAKAVQEDLIRKSGIPYTILHSTQFFEFVNRIAQEATIGQEVHASTGAMQPIAAVEVVAALADIAVGQPRNADVEVAGPVRMPMSEFIRFYMNATEDSRQLIPDENARYFGMKVDDRLLVPGQNPILGKIKYEDWFANQKVGA